MKLYDSILSIAESLGCSFDYALLVFVVATVIFFALAGWVYGLLFDIGHGLYGQMKRFALSLFSKVQKKKP